MTTSMHLDHVLLYPLEREATNLSFAPVPHMNETKIAVSHQKKLVSDLKFLPDSTGGGWNVEVDVNGNFFTGFSCW